jgi:hypothetical protein
MADSEDDFDSVLRSVGAAAEPTDGEEEFDVVAKGVGLGAPKEPAALPVQKQTMGTGNPHLDNLLKWYTGMAEAATMNHAGEIGEAGSRIGTALADMLQPSRTRDGMAPEIVGRRGANADELVQRSMDSLPGKLGYGAGILAPVAASGGVSALGIPAAAASIPARAAIGAAQGGLAAHGDSGLDPQAILTGAATGGALAGLGGALGARAESTVPLTHATRAEQALKTLSEAAAKGGGQMGAGAAAGALLSGSKDPVDIAKSAAMGALGGKALGMAGAAAPKLAPMVAPALRALGTAAAPVAGAAAGRVSKAQAQADVAYGTAPTMAWAVESVLTSGDSGLEPKDEQQLTEAVMSGDEDRVIAANFSLSQRSPAYAARLRRELESLQEE